MVQTKQLVHVIHVATLEAYADRDPVTVAAVEIGGVRSLIVVPMLKEDELIGALTLARQEVGPWRTKADADLKPPSANVSARHRLEKPVARFAPCWRPLPPNRLQMCPDVRVPSSPLVQETAQNVRRVDPKAKVNIAVVGSKC